MNTDKDVLIGKVLSGNASQSETKELADWLAQDANNRLIFKAAKQVWCSSIALKKEIAVDTQSAWEEFKSLTKPTPSTVRGLLSPTLKIAASLLLIASSTLLIWFYLQHSDSRKKDLAVKNRMELQNKRENKVSVPGHNSTALHVASSEAVKPHLVVSVSSGDSIAVFNLPDGSKVYLNRQSKLHYENNYGKKRREVYLSGEAFFEVKKTGSEFFVFCSGTKTRVLGTAFNVNGNSKQGSVIVSLAEGHVEFTGKHPEDTPTLMVPGEKLICKANSTVYEKHKVNKKEMRWWKQNRLKHRFKKLIHRILEKLK